VTIAARARLPVFLEREKTQTITLALYDGASAAPPASGTVTVYDAAGTSVAAGVAVPTLTGVSFEVTSAQLPASLAFSTAWRVAWVLVYATPETVKITQQCHLVRSSVYAVVTQVDLYERHPELARLLPIDPATGVQQTSWATQIEAAFVEIQQRLLLDAKRANLILNSWSLAPLHLSLALGRIFRLLGTGLPGPGGKYDTESQKYLAEYETAWGQLRSDYDYDETGTISEGEENVAGEAVVYLSATPAAWWYGDRIVGGS
jgi:hypothetical protein